MARTNDRFRILVVCTGNICRSPMAQAMLLHRLRERLGPDKADAVFDVSSAGTYGLVGEPMEPDAMTALSELGITPDAFQARLLEEQLVDDADLVLTATRQHRTAVATLAPDCVSRTFTVRELARLLDAVDDVPSVGAADDVDVVRRLAALISAAAGQRGSVGAPSPEDDDVADPYRRDVEEFRRAGAQLDEATRTIADRLAEAVER